MLAATIILGFVLGLQINASSLTPAAQPDISALRYNVPHIQTTTFVDRPIRVPTWARPRLLDFLEDTRRVASRYLPSPMFDHTTFLDGQNPFSHSRHYPGQQKHLFTAFAANDQELRFTWMRVLDTLTGMMDLSVLREPLDFSKSISICDTDTEILLGIALLLPRDLGTNIGTNIRIH